MLFGLEARGLAAGTTKDDPGPAKLTPKEAALLRTLTETVAPRTTALFSSIPPEGLAIAHRVLREIIDRAPAITSAQDD